MSRPFGNRSRGRGWSNSSSALLASSPYRGATINQATFHGCVLTGGHHDPAATLIDQIGAGPTKGKRPGLVFVRTAGTPNYQSGVFGNYPYREIARRGVQDLKAPNALKGDKDDNR